MSFAGKTAIITGASSGIGKLIAEGLARGGANVVLAARSAEQLNDLAAAINQTGAKALAVATDVSDAQAVQALVEQAVATFGRVDLLINNAGYGIFDSIEQIEWKHLEGMITVNYFGAMHCIRAVLPVMRKQNSGHIVNVASVAGLVSTHNMGSYSASKHALMAASEALQIELRGTPIKCSLVCPAPIATPFFESADFNKMSRFASIFGMLKPHDVTEIVLHVAANPTTQRVIPRIYHVFGVAYRIFPAFTRWLVKMVG